MSENGVEIIDICSDEKENVLKEKTVKKDGENINNNNIVIINEKKASESAKPGFYFLYYNFTMRWLTLCLLISNEAIT